MHAPSCRQNPCGGLIRVLQHTACRVSSCQCPASSLMTSLFMSQSLSRSAWFILSSASPEQLPLPRFFRRRLPSPHHRPYGWQMTLWAVIWSPAGTKGIEIESGPLAAVSSVIFSILMSIMFMDYLAVFCPLALLALSDQPLGAVACW